MIHKITVHYPNKEPMKKIYDKYVGPEILYFRGDKHIDILADSMVEYLETYDDIENILDCDVGGDI